MSLETGSDRPTGTIKPKLDALEPAFGSKSVPSADLSNSVWGSMKLASQEKVSQPDTGALLIESPYFDLKPSQINARSEYAAPGHAQSSGARAEATKTQKNPDGGHTDSTTGPSGSKEVATYDQNGKLTFKRTDNPDGTFSEWKVDARGHVSIREKKTDGSLRTRDEYPNGNFKEETKYKDGTRSLSSHFADSDGAYTDDKINRDGSQSLSRYDKDGNLTFKYTKNKDGSSSQRKVNDDGSVVFKDEKADGSYTESRTDKTGTSRTIHTVNKADGSSETKKYDTAGQLTSERKTKRDKSFTETTYNADGTKTIHDEDAKGGYSEQYLNSKGERISPTIAVAKTASPEFVQKVKDELARLPEPIRKLLIKNDAIIAVTGKMSDVDPKEAKIRPRGYEKGETGDDSPGVQAPIVDKNGKKHELAVIAEKTRSGPNDDIEGTVRHEVGHVVDALLKHYSHSPQFKAAYDKDVAQMSKETKEDEKYLLLKGNKGNDGREETFAEVVRAVTGDPTEARNAEVLKLFPKLVELVKKRLSELPQ